MVALAMAMPTFTSCYDDSALNAKVDEVIEEVNKIQSDLAALKTAVENEVSVVEYNEIEGGYELVMSDGSKIYLYNGKDGANGTNGTDGAQGEKGDKGDTGAAGNDGAQGEQGPQGPQGPQGEQGEKGDAFFQSVELSEDGLYLIITLVDGTVYNLPMGGFNVVFTLTDDAKAALKAGDAAEVAYSIVGAAENDVVVVRVLASSNCEAVVLADKQVVKVTPAALGEGYVDIYAINNTTGDIKANTVSFDGHTCTVETTTFLVSPKGGNVEVPVVTSVDYELEIDGAWLTYVETKAVATETVVLSAVAENTSGKTNEATVTVKVAGKAVATFTVTQKSYEPKLIGEYLETYSQYGSPYSGTLKIEFTDDLSKGTYKVTICGTTLYADYEAGKLYCYDGKYTRTITVASDFTKFEVSNLSLGYSTYSDYVAILALGPAVLTEAEQALVGVYNETWTHPNQQPAVNGMEISASEEASFGQLKVKFFTTTDGSSFTAYASLEDSKLKVAVGGMNHPKFGTIWDPSAVIEFTLEADGTLTLAQWQDGNWKNMTDYVATKFVENEGGEPEAPAADPIAGTWSVTCEMGDTWGSNFASKTGEMVITGADGEYVIVSIAGVAYNLSATFDGNVLTASKNGATMSLAYDADNKTLTFTGTFQDWEHNAIKNIVATKDAEEEGGEPEAPAADPIAGTWSVTCEMGDTWGSNFASKTGEMVITGADGEYVIVSIAGVAYNLSATFDGNVLTASKNGATMSLAYDADNKTLTFTGTFQDWEHNAIKNIVATKN